MSKPKVYDNVIATTNSSVSGKAPGSVANSGSKAKMRFPHSPLGVGQSNGQAGKAKVHALTPGTTPTGS
jgi:hypothetical protein